MSPNAHRKSALMDSNPGWSLISPAMAHSTSIPVTGALCSMSKLNVIAWASSKVSSRGPGRLCEAPVCRVSDAPSSRMGHRELPDCLYFLLYKNRQVAPHFFVINYYESWGEVMAAMVEGQAGSVGLLYAVSIAPSWPEEVRGRVTVDIFCS
jgi:hypothetical protein